MDLKACLVKARLLEIEKGKMGAGFCSAEAKEELVRCGWVRKSDGKLGARKGRAGGKGGLELTDAGRRQVKVVMTGGVFDILHLGHVYTLEKARKMGDALVVVVAHDKTVRKRKGRPAVHSARQRAELLQKLRCVDLALIGDARDKEEVVRRVRPDVVVFGYDQKVDERLRARVRRIKGRMKGQDGREVKTSGIIDRM